MVFLHNDFHDLSHWYLILGTVLLLPSLWIIVKDFFIWRHMPKGPTPIPFVGNKFQIARRRPWIQFQQWSKIYGPIYTVWFGRRPTLIISDPNVAVDLLEKRSNKYSSRPRFVTMGELYWKNSSILVQPYNKQWSVRRKLLHVSLTPTALRSYRKIQEAEVARFCHDVLQSQSLWEASVDRLMASIVFSIAYGHRIDSLKSAVMTQRFKFMQYSASLNVPGAYLVESFPALKYIPNFLAPWKAEIEKRGREEAAANKRLVEYVIDDIEQAKQSLTPMPESLTRQLLEKRAEDPDSFSLLSDRDFTFIPASLFGAGADTTASTLCSAVLALVTHPETLHAVHAEMDEVVGLRMPTFQDELHLPYLRAFCKEVLRWRPVAVLGGTPHASSESDIYQRYRIPKGTSVLCNSWAINLSEEFYPDPHQFNPLRFLEVDPISLKYLNSKYLKTTKPEKGKAHPSKLGHSSFGWGRRICPGADLASSNLFIALARLLWAFKILPAKGEVYDTFAYTEGFNIRPQKFKCEIQVRGPEYEKVVREEYEGALKVLQTYAPFNDERMDE